MKKNLMGLTVMCAALACGTAKAETRSSDVTDQVNEMGRVILRMDQRLTEAAVCCTTGKKDCADKVVALRNDAAAIRPRVVHSGDNGLKAKFADLERKIDALDTKLDSLPAATAKETVDQLSTKFGDVWKQAAEQSNGRCYVYAKPLMELIKSGKNDATVIGPYVTNTLKPCLDQAKDIMTKELGVQALHDNGGSANMDGLAIWVDKPNQEALKAALELERARTATVKAQAEADAHAAAFKAETEARVRREDAEAAVRNEALRLESVARAEWIRVHGISLFPEPTPPTGATSSSTSTTSGKGWCRANPGACAAVIIAAIVVPTTAILLGVGAERGWFRSDTNVTVGPAATRALLAW